MARRIFKPAFRFYTALIALPFLVAGLVLSIYPSPVLPWLFEDPQTDPGSMFFLLVRIIGVSFLYITVTIFVMRNDPNRLINLGFWQAILCFALAGFAIASPFWFKASYYVLIPGAYWLVSGIFLFAFASRSLVVRES